MNADEMRASILNGFVGIVTAENAGDTFFTYDPDGDLPQDRWLPFATLVTGDNYDTVSDLTRRGAYRINIGLTKATYVSLLGPAPTERDEHGLLRTGVDYTVSDTVLPHPFYASQYWVCVVNPGDATLDTVRTLLAEAYDFAVHKYTNRAARG
jgi:Family of unknown function (DUF6194)